ncbi:MAG: hypothetical protein KDJ17_07245 [Hyphomicrobiaceae bacterium]|nr:hypothetical protein [Hyphomicrobiaceae bacterium]
MSDLLRAGLIVAAMVLALMLKFERYGHEAVASSDAAAARVSTFMATHGWTRTGDLNSENGVYEQLTFRRDGCTSPVLIAFLKGNAEAAEFFRRDHAGDVMFVQGGTVVEKPSGLTRLRQKLNGQVAAMLNQESPPQMPVLAISPAADRNVSDCRGPAVAIWNLAGQEMSIR